MAPSKPITATSTIPYIYRLLITTFEPLFALGGSLGVFSAPQTYLSTLSHSNPPYNPKTSFIYSQLCGAWLMFAFNEAVVLRLVDDLRVWKLLCWGMLVSDACYCWSCAEAVGGWADWIKVGAWGFDDWVVTVTTLPFVLVRLLLVAGIGVKATGRKSE